MSDSENASTTDNDSNAVEEQKRGDSAMALERERNSLADVSASEGKDVADDDDEDDEDAPNQSVLNSKWEESFQRLLAFKEKHGHCLGEFLRAGLVGCLANLNLILILIISFVFQFISSSKSLP